MIQYCWCCHFQAKVLPFQPKSLLAMSWKKINNLQKINIYLNRYNWLIRAEVFAAELFQKNHNFLHYMRKGNWFELLEGLNSGSGRSREGAQGAWTPLFFSRTEARRAEKKNWGQTGPRLISGSEWPGPAPPIWRSGSTAEWVKIYNNVWLIKGSWILLESWGRVQEIRILMQ